MGAPRGSFVFSGGKSMTDINIKKIKLVADPPFHNSVDVAVIDFPGGIDGRQRQRCKVKVEFAKFDVEQLKKQGLDYDGAMEHYRDWFYSVVRYHIASDWECVGGYEEVFDIIRQRVGAYYI